MASYPTSVKSFTTKNTGDVVQASHINDLQDEVNAIEAGLRNGTAPINAAGSTVTSLVVTGGSTLASLVVSGGSTLATLQAGGSTFSVRPVEPPPDAAQVTLAAAFNLANNSTTAITWAEQTYLINSSMHSTASNSDRLVPQSTGLWCITGNIVGSVALTQSTASLRVVIEDSSGAELAKESETGAGGHEPGLNLVGYKRFDSLAASPWARIVARVKDGGSTQSLSTVSWLAMRKL